MEFFHITLQSFIIINNIENHHESMGKKNNLTATSYLYKYQKDFYDQVGHL